MSRVGRPSYPRERWIKNTIRGLLLSKPRGLSFTELVRMASEYGIAKSTLSRYLRMFEKSRLLILNGKFYRINPLYGYTKKAMDEYVLSPWAFPEGIRLYFVTPFMVRSHNLGRAYPGHIRVPPHVESVEQAEKQMTDYTKFKDFNSDLLLDWWAPSIRPYILGHISSWNEEALRKSFERAVTHVMAEYLAVLNKISDAPDVSSASEIANIMYEREIRYTMMEFARVVWETRRLVPLKALGGMKLSQTVEYHPPASKKGLDARRS